MPVIYWGCMACSDCSLSNFNSHLNDVSSGPLVFGSWTPPGCPLVTSSNNIYRQGVDPPEVMMHFPPVSDSPHFWKIFRLYQKFSKFYLFPKNFSILIRQNFWWPFLVIDHKFRISPFFFPVSIHFPLFRLNYYSPPYLMCISFPSALTMMHLCITQCTYWTPLSTWIIMWQRY